MKLSNEEEQEIWQRKRLEEMTRDELLATINRLGRLRCQAQIEHHDLCKALSRVLDMARAVAI